MSITVAFYGRMPSGEEVLAYTLTRGKLSARILTYGATLDALWVPDREGRLGNILLGFDSLEDRMARSSYQGETVGRYANRIAGAKFTLNGKEYALTANEKGRTCLHGGGEFSHTVWAAEPGEREDYSCLRLTYTSPAGSMGFPGTVEADALYLLDEDGLCITYSARTDVKTPVNMTNHAYFNLACEGDVLGHVLQINAEAYLPIDECSIPMGEVRPVEGTAFDFRAAKPIGQDITSNDPQLIQCKGYDHNFCIAGDAKTPAAIVYEPGSGRRMELCTNQPGVQLYTGNFLNAPGKDGKQYSGFCLETQAWPDSPNRPEFRPYMLIPGKEYFASTTLAFGIM